MTLFNDLMISLGLAEKPSSANTAKERLKVVVSHSGSRRRGGPDYLPMLEKDILAVIAKYVEVDEDKVKVRFDRGDSQSTLEVNVDLPSEITSGTAKRKTSKPVSDDEEKAKLREDMLSSARAFGTARKKELVD